MLRQMDNSPSSDFNVPHKILKSVLVVFILLTGLLLRLDALHVWKNSPDLFFTQDQPLLSNLDGYYYLQIAKELKNGTYSTIDKKRGFPDGVGRQPIPSLLPTTIYSFNKLTNISLNWIGVFLPVVLGLSIAIPLYLFGYHLGGFFIAFGSIAIGTHIRYYAIRTAMGRLDTDCLNVSLALICAFLFMRFGISKDVKRYYYLAGGIFCYLVFLWWWDMSAAAATFLGLGPLIIGLIFHFRPKGQERYTSLFSLGIVALLALLLIGYQTVFEVILSAGQQLLYVFKQDSGLFFNISPSISEQQRLSLSQITPLTISNLPVLLCSVIGAVWLFIKHKKVCIYLLPIIIIGSFSTFSAKRFTIFLTPVVALGFAFFFYQFYHFFKQRRLVLVCYGLLIIHLTIHGLMLGTARPAIFHSKTIEGMRKLKQITPKNSAIWSWWDEGHPLIYWSDRSTITCGYIHGGARTYFNAIPLATDNERLAANLMRFYATRGISGIDRFIQSTSSTYQKGVDTLLTLLAGGPENVEETGLRLNLVNQSYFKTTQQLQEFLFPEKSPPVFLFLDSRMIRIQRWIYWFGTWNTTARSGDRTLPTFAFYDIKFDQDLQPINNAFEIDYENGKITVKNIFEKPIKLTETAITKNDQTKLLNYSNVQSQKHLLQMNSQKLARTLSNLKLYSGTGEYVLEVMPQIEHAIIHDQKKADVVINRLFRRKNDFNPQYFQPIDLSQPHYQIWAVTGDRISQKNN